MQGDNNPGPSNRPPKFLTTGNVLSVAQLELQYNSLFSALTKLRPGEQIHASGLHGSLTALVCATFHRLSEQPLLYVGGTRVQAEGVASDLRHEFGTGQIATFLGKAHSQKEPAGADDVATLRMIASSQPNIVVTHLGMLGCKVPSKATTQSQTVALASGSECDFQTAVQMLAMLGFEKKDLVGSPGEFAQRGGILDVFSFGAENPVRLEFHGNAIESIREFDPASQRSIRELSETVLVGNILQAGEDKTGIPFLGLLERNVFVILDEQDAARRTYEQLFSSSTEQLISWEELTLLLKEFRGLQIHSIAGDTTGVRFGSLPQPSFNRSIKHVHEFVRRLLREDYKVVLTSDTLPEMNRLQAMLVETGESLPGRDSGAVPADFSRVLFSHHALNEGFILPDAKLAVLTEHQIFERLKRKPHTRRPRFHGISEREFSRLRKGDFVVHEDYGIGKFDGLKKISVQNVEQEVVKVVYDENDILYVNLNYLGKLQKYSSKEGHVPKLTKLGRPDWEKLKSRAKGKIKDIARDLIKLYAQRKAISGFAFAPDAPWQKELEASFLYEDTFDQAKATRDVKEDMEAPHPMDRLICGDVGFGKTEVAIRAAFKAVMNGKQAGVLVPTTILAMQHHRTFVDRTSPFSTRVEVLSRFRTRQEQLRILHDVQAGAVDIVIGTHRLLSKDVVFKDLGLLIIDEEHRFGVDAKEKLRKLRAHVDTLTLTATPIPRTLHFSLMGARDLSIIATPPRNRLPVITEIVRFDNQRIRDAVLREIGRGGQVYFVHDRVQDIEDVAARVQSLAPTIRVRTAHGQMRATDLEKVMVDFLERKFDVLVCTKIIESGLDIPNVNTIIIHRADRFGMAELYQLRGRVGRSNIQAYAYAVVPPLETLSRETLQRLQAIEEFTDLGSGFQLAMRDLEIRGAGNLLGGEQSGFIETMGFETYSRILDEAIREIKLDEFKDVFAGESQPAPADAVVETEMSALLPESYVSREDERMELYRRLYSVNTNEQIEEIAEELKDRFGTVPPEAENLLGVVRVRLASSKIGFIKVHISSGKIQCEFPPESNTAFYESKQFQLMMQQIGSMKNQGVNLRHQGGKLTVSALVGPQDRNKPISTALSFLGALASEPPSQASA